MDVMTSHFFLLDVIFLAETSVFRLKLRKMKAMHILGFSLRKRHTVCVLREIITRCEYCFSFYYS